MTARNRLVEIVDYQAGNIQSIESAFGHLGANVRTIETVAALDGVTHIVLPGVGAFGYCAERLAATGMVPALAEAVLERATPLLGICVGMQLLSDHGEEMGGHAGPAGLGESSRRCRRPRPRSGSPMSAGTMCVSRRISGISQKATAPISTSITASLIMTRGWPDDR